ncbi:MAG: WYL domain-containing protein [Bacteroidales bacterium]|nr:WYL domain-containing protein [Bacteroidales bacterium]
MPASKNALIRYRTIDRCLRNRYRRWTLEDLIEACSDALYEYEGRDENVSRRTVQMDIQMMRSDKLGYNAPIKVVDRKYYIYEDPDFSITESPLSAQDVEKMGQAVKVLRQLSGFREFAGMEGIVGQLEDLAHSKRENTPPVIFFDKNDRLKGLEHIEPIHGAILRKRPLRMEYQSFRARNDSAFIFHPYALKEFNNRWFVFGRRKGVGAVLNLALDRILSLEEDGSTPFMEDPSFNPEKWFSDMVGVTKTSSDKPQRVLLLVSREEAPYILTKPLHSSQKMIERRKDGCIIVELKVILNRELVRLLLGYAEGIKVLQPRRLAAQVKEHLSKAVDLYGGNIPEKDTEI